MRESDWLPGENGRVPETASAERERLAREAARRRQAVTLLRIGECACRYAAQQLSNGTGSGTGPLEARAAAMEAAAELVVVAEAVRRLAALEPGERRALAVQLASAGWSMREVAERVGVSESAVYGYLRPASPEGELRESARVFEAHSTAVE